MLGNGTFGLVIQAVDTEAQVEVAIKLLPRGNFIKNFKTYVNREILHQSSLKHPFIISLREVCHHVLHMYNACEVGGTKAALTYFLATRPYMK